jgi:pyrimidine deaminase RibD-like protein
MSDEIVDIEMVKVGLEEVLSVLDEKFDSETIYGLLEEINRYNKNPFSNKYNEHLTKLISKWSEQLRGLSTENEIKTLACLFENQERILTELFSENDKLYSDFEKIKIFISTISGNDELEKTLRNSYEVSLKNAHDKDVLYSSGIREKNFYKETRKVFEIFPLKMVVNIQPMTGPLSLAYGLRFKTTDNKGVVGLTVEQKEIVAKTAKMKNSDAQEVSNIWEFSCIESILEIAKVSKVTTLENIDNECVIIAKDTHLGPGYHYITTRDNPNNTIFCDKYTPVYVESGASKELLGDNIILCKGVEKDEVDRENSKGIMLAPYIPFMFSKSIEKDATYGVMTRFGVTNQVPKTEDFYTVLDFSK